MNGTDEHTLETQIFKYLRKSLKVQLDTLGNSKVVRVFLRNPSTGKFEKISVHVEATSYEQT